MKKMSDKKLIRCLITSIVTVIVLASLLCVTSFTLIHASLSVKGNIFSTGEVRINLNGGKTIINEDEFLFKSGTEVKKDFYIENLSTCGVWYRLFFDHIEGDLGKYLDVQILDGKNVLSSGKLSELTKDKVSAYDSPLESGEKKNLTISFQLSEEIGNDAMNQFLIFDFGAEAVQVRNNPDKKFN